ncbi:MAG: Hpt domain-containing protein [Bacteroidetes bacterium]|nr:MAG: Hpt domain-containing protein [Bacteroidota bacterium]
MATMQIDLSQLRTLTGDDNEFMIEILELILEQSPVVVEDMKRMLSQGDYPALGATAHKYKSSINILGNPDLNQLMRVIENTARDSEQKDILPDAVREFESYASEMLDLIRTEVDLLRD